MLAPIPIASAATATATTRTEKIVLPRSSQFKGRGWLGGELAAPSSDPFSPYGETCGVHKTRSAQERQLRTAALFGRNPNLRTPHGRHWYPATIRYTLNSAS
jgi:hypothetical protein